MNAAGPTAPDDGDGGGGGRSVPESPPGLTVVSFDIDGTLQFGDPAGPVPVDVVRAVLAAGHVVGSASDRTSADQRRLWSSHEVEVAFVGGKHHLPDVRRRFAAARYVHLGDTDVDGHYARQAGFEFLRVDELVDPHQPTWL